ncbi:MAG: Flp family type IVb pilin [Gemmataceae bacterium]|nr:Flp family type IVb pilin [Gemmataceae bacterium]
MFGWMVSRVLTFLRREDGPTAVEYAVMLALILMAVFAAVAQIGGHTSDMYNNLTLQGVKVKVP